MCNEKQIFKASTLKKLLIDENSCVSLVATTRLLDLPPFFLNDMKSGIVYVLNNMLKKYDRWLDGIVMGYQNIKVLMDENTGIIPMGTYETKVNISVEFYIFQPKIGSFLEGVVNKKSNSHIGCLVHRYFNAIILKPEDVDYDEWMCKDFNVNDKIIFKVKYLDFSSLLPLIEGVIDSEILSVKVKRNLEGSFNLCSDVKSVNKRCSNDVLFSENGAKNIDDLKESILKDNFNNDSPQFDPSFTNARKKKKKKKNWLKEEKEYVNLSDSHKQMDKEEDSGDKEWTSLGKELNVDEKYYVKKKKKKAKKKQEDADVKNTENTPGSSNEKTSDASNNLEKLDAFESKNTNDFVKPGKIKKEKHKKKDELEESHAEVNKTNQCLFLNEAGDNIFYSSPLDLSLPKKMKILCCSPISKSITFEEKSPKRNLKSEKEADEKEKKQKRKKPKRGEKKPEGLSEPKKIKTSHSSFSEKESTKDMMNFNDDESIVRTMMEELCRKQLDRIKEEFNKPEKESSKEQKKKKKKLKNEEKMLNLNKSKKGQVNGGSGTEQNSQIHSLLDELRKQEMQRVKEELNISDRESCKEIKKVKMKMKKEKKEISREEARESLCNLEKRTKTQLNSAGEDEKKLSVQDMMHQLLEQEMNRVKEEFKKYAAKILKEGKKPKRVNNKQEEASKEKAPDSSCEKLLKEGKSAMDLDKGKTSSLLPARDSCKGKKEKKDLSNLKSFFEMSGSAGKKDRNSQKTKDCRDTAKNYKNGSMYDAALTPEEINFDKSLFSDSEKSNSSPAKRQKKEVNGIEANFIGQSPFSKETEAMKNGSGKKKERASRKSEQDHDSLIEKLLREAKSSIQSRNERSPMKKKTFRSP